MGTHTTTATPRWNSPPKVTVPSGSVCVGDDYVEVSVDTNTKYVLVELSGCDSHRSVVEITTGCVTIGRRMCRFDQFDHGSHKICGARLRAVDAAGRMAEGWSYFLEIPVPRLEPNAKCG